MMACSITEYQDPKPICDKLDGMLSLPPTAIKINKTPGRRTPAHDMQGQAGVNIKATPRKTRG